MRTFVGAGTETTGNMLQATVFHLLNNPETVIRLKEELKEAQRNSTTLLTPRDLQQIPYLVLSTFPILIAG